MQVREGGTEGGILEKGPWDEGRKAYRERDHGRQGERERQAGIPHTPGTRHNSHSIAWVLVPCLGLSFSEAALATIPKFPLAMDGHDWGKKRRLLL